jgi:hypothetical protein
LSEDGICSVSLDYNGLLTVTSQSLSIDFPILDDPVLIVTMPNPSTKLIDAAFITFYWLITIFALAVGFMIVLSTADCLSKPERKEFRFTPLRQPESILNLQKDEDVVYATLRKINQAITFRLSLNSPLASILC